MGCQCSHEPVSGLHPQPQLPLPQPSAPSVHLSAADVPPLPPKAKAVAASATSAASAGATVLPGQVPVAADDSPPQPSPPHPRPPDSAMELPKVLSSSPSPTGTIPLPPLPPGPSEHGAAPAEGLATPSAEEALEAACPECC
eukprot:RCo033705